MLLTHEQLAVASDEERALYFRSLELELALASPLDYARYVTKGTKDYPHTRLLSSLIVRLVTGRLIHPDTGLPTRKLAVSMPPRHGKSYVISDHTPPWAVTKWADVGFRVADVGYEADFAATWGKKARDRVSAHPEFGTALDTRSRAAEAWDLVPKEPGLPRAGMNTAGVGGPLTGKGFDLLIIDDPIKNNEWAMSPTIREKQWDWLGSTALTRLESTKPWTDPLTDTEYEIGHAVILVNTRWHEDDMMGRVLRDEPEKWYHLNLKALADDVAPEHDPLRRQPGEALCPDLFDEAALAEIRTDPSTGGYWWAAMYQGEPNIEGGGIFKRTSFRYHRPGPGDTAVTHYALRDPSGQDLYVPRAELSRFSTLDLAATVKTTSDWSVLSTWDVTPDRRMLLVDRVRQRLESADLTDWLIAENARLKPLYIGIGAKTFGLAVITQLSRAGVPVRPLPENDDKISRAIPAGNLCDSGRVFFPEGAPWLHEWEHELLQFPNGRHDDQVDTFSLAARELTLGPWSVAARDKSAPDLSTEARLKKYVADRRRNEKKARRKFMSGRL